MNILLQLQVTAMTYRSFFGSDYRRTSYEILVEILESCRKPQKKTRVMYKTNNSYDSITKYLQQLQGMRLLQKEAKTGNTFKITERGIEFLEKWYQLQNLLNNEEELEVRLRIHC
jgi:predicted transcriptional regulator